MRQNGLRASSFVAVADVDPRIADQLLDLLAFAHVAAYAEPVPGRVGVYRDHHVPTRPIDRLWVDREATGPAREVLDRSLAHLHAELETAIAEGVLAVGPGADRPAGRAAEVPEAVTGEPAAPRPAPVDGVQDGQVPAVAVGPSGPAAPVGADAGAADPSAPAATDERDAGRTAPDSAALPAAVRPDGVPEPGTGPEVVQDGPGGVTGGGVTDGGVTDSGATDGGVSGHPARLDGDELDQAAVDARWRDIVAGWDGPVGEGSGLVADPPTGRRGSPGTPPPHPLGSDTSWPAAAPPAPRPGDRRRTDRGPVDPSLRRDTRADGRSRELPGPRDHAPDPADDHFSPPVPTAHPPLEKTTRLGWAGLVVGLVVLVAVVAVGSDLLPRWVPLLGVALLVGGFAALVSRLHRSPPDEDDHDPDDGAVV